jgi:hypothetical protein
MYYFNKRHGSQYLFLIYRTGGREDMFQNKDVSIKYLILETTSYGNGKLYCTNGY